MSKSMKNEEAISCLMNFNISFSRGNGKTRLILALKKAIAALEKQIQKKPDYEGDGYDENGNLIYDTWICPNCGKHYEVDYDDYDFCPDCGQAIDKALDWSDEE